MPFQLRYLNKRIDLPIEFSRYSDKIANPVNIGIKKFLQQQNNYLQWGSTWWSLVQESNAQSIELTWDI